MYGVYRWVLGVALLAAGSLPVLAALWTLGTEAEQGQAFPSVLVLAGLGGPALIGGGYLVAAALRDEKRASRR